MAAKAQNSVDIPDITILWIFYECGKVFVLNMLLYIYVYFWSLVALHLDVSGQNADNKILTRTV